MTILLLCFMLTNDNYSPGKFLFTKDIVDVSDLYEGYDEVD